ncbi:MAG: hypothetical protein CMJ23_07635, partial [Phycisphaerae bacterium]|nr:hypothetical protein [Phycisphaerae bacterium]
MRGARDDLGGRPPRPRHDPDVRAGPFPGRLLANSSLVRRKNHRVTTVSCQNAYAPQRKKLHIAADRAGPPSQTLEPDPRGLEPLADPPSFEPIEIDMNDITKIFSTLIALIGASGSLHADIITVCPDGTCDFTSVDAAITAAADGDRIEIGSGVYDLSQSHDLEERRIEIVGVAETDEPAPRLELTNNVQWDLGDFQYRIESVEFVGEAEGVPTHRLSLGRSTLETDLRLQGCRFQGLKDQLIRVFTVDIDDCVFDNC